jgi:twitching motility protein PilT
MMNIMDLLAEAVEKHASDLHLVVGVPPALRVYGEIVLTESPALRPDDCKEIVYGMLTDSQREQFEKELQLGFSFFVPDLGRFRVNVYHEKGFVEAAFRVGMMEIKSPEQLGLPPIVSDLVRKPNGLLLITGPTGVGKTTSLNSLIDLINRERRAKIITIEDPVEYVHNHKKSIVVQQEVYSDTHSFAKALFHALRQDPDIIGVGEMRDLETMSTALTAAETGHLVIATLHTIDASQTIDRIIDVFPGQQQPQVIAQLASCLVGVVSQQLLPRADKQGLSLCCEILVANLAVRNLIREHKTEKIYSTIQTAFKDQMQTMDRSLRELYQAGTISYDEAVTHARDPQFIEK